MFLIALDGGHCQAEAVPGAKQQRVISQGRFA